MGNASSDGSKAADEAHAARLQTVTSFVELAGTFFPALSLDTLVFVPRSVLLDGQRKVLPLYGEVQRHLVDYNKVCAKHPNAKLLYLSYIPAERVPDKFGQRRSILGSEERQLWEELFSAVATFLQDHTEFAFVWAPRCCLGGAKATLPGGANMLEHCNPLALLVRDAIRGVCALLRTVALSIRTLKNVECSAANVASGAAWRGCPAEVTSAFVAMSGVYWQFWRDKPACK
eukprot:TRINITY_DN2004_c1_g1_i5.p1 TRINITY_DN2004_c1_g1~~TRINITY_DN2004_c1_g1_i5.p1  ORF type:complete len:231 (-),score=38.42 TRINITY_DN2004_c1_g1_i5:105-797(-)